jgi:murein DD-endopeptidase MepM/ murein hydrolase activator NlpD
LGFGLWVVVSLACTGTLAAPTPGISEPPTIVWSTNTPGPITTGIAQPPPTETPLPPTPTSPATATLPAGAVDTSPYLYHTQAGDTLHSLSLRFSVLPEEITSTDPLPPTGFINPDQLLVIPRRLYNTSHADRLIPDSEVVYGPSAIEFNIPGFVGYGNGYLNTFSEYLGTTGQTTGAQVISRVGLENSVNPRLLLALLEYQSGWVFGTPSEDKSQYPMGYIDTSKKGLFQQLTWASDQLGIGYYGWREGTLTEITFSDGVTVRLAPDLNAGTVAVMYFFAQLNDSASWIQVLNPETGFPALYTQLYGNPWLMAASVEPLYPPTLTQPLMILPFAVDQIWAYSGGPHGAWTRLGARAAIDFAPGNTEPGCVPSQNWVVAAASGLVVRSGKGVLVLDMDGDGFEQTGWVLAYLHIATESKIPVGSWVVQGQFLGYPSCEGGFSTGTHIHIARKYNGEWMLAGGPLPFTLSGWVAGAGENPYEGTLTRDGLVLTANPYGTADTRIIRAKDDS